MPTSTVKPIPDGMHTITPHLVCKGASDAIAFYIKAFNAVEHSRLPGPDGTVMHAMLGIGDSTLMLGEEFENCGHRSPLALKGSPVTLHLYVNDVDASFAQAVEAGAKVIMPVTDMFWGDRYGQVEDPFGHRWSLATHMRDLSPEQIREGMAASMPQQ
ncbi:glyoxalase/bleomycin resistance protein/dioxygenase superfamily protein [Caballeronia sordidicola]|uniref:Glyoxalase/bleomycin resistance protein/dioxygenase superfamily protein n=1 Tax=Caballeronia sordidicola TaxID=196367 RepID=A0A158G8V4_CABSO|nr:VOC family protein [Caballeronia sordidicola]SAL28462.1 glyoxalase/bleomycin resistance protein/dioxygenase superfamily protein [Caballeronia sordidicola]